MTDKAMLKILRRACAEYNLEPRAIFQRSDQGDYPFTVVDSAHLEAELEVREHFLPLPTEPASLANVVEVSLVRFLVDELGQDARLKVKKGTERGYPDLEVTADDQVFAVDIKVARRSKSLKQTQSRITLYTGNTYFRYPQLKWPQTFRPFQDYQCHIDIIVIYTLNRESLHRIEDVEVLVHPSWEIASRQRSSTTREYIGAVTNLDDLRAGKGEFKSEEEFLAFWRAYPFKIGKSVQKHLDKLLKEMS
jgi:restriction endonuclease EcoRV